MASEVSKSLTIKTRVFELYHENYNGLPELAGAMELSLSQLYRVRSGERGINRKFIIGASKAFPGHTLDELFYIVPERADD